MNLPRGRLLTYNMRSKLPKPRMKGKVSREIALDANIKVHSALVNAGEYQKSPHFRKENIEKVQAIISSICQKIPKENSKAIDFGCGTGFMIDIINGYFEEVHGVDITEDMMRNIDLTPGNIYLHKCMAENTNFADSTFDFACAYSFMDHLVDYKEFLKEVYRVLKNGGIFYTDLNPNRAFIDSMKKAETYSVSNISDAMKREIAGAIHNGEYYASNFNINAEELENAEPIKSYDRGFDELEVYKTCKQLGFRECKIEYEWFIGQGNIHHEVSSEVANIMDRHLKSLAPTTSGINKYLRVICKK